MSVISVNGEVIATEAIQREADRLRPDYERFVKDEGGEPSEEQLRDWSRENLIERALLRQEADRRAESVDTEELERRLKEQADPQNDARFSPAKLKETIATDLRLEKMLETLQARTPEPTFDEILAYYEAHPQEFDLPEQIHARHIVRHLDDRDREEVFLELLNVRSRLAQGGAWETEIGPHSDCGDNSGDLGWFGRGAMVPSFEDVVFRLAPGEISDVFETEFGLHLAQTLERRPPGPAHFDEVRGGIMRKLRTQRENAAVENLIDTLRAKAVIVEEN